MPSYLLVLDLGRGAVEHTVNDIACIHRDEYQVAFYAADHVLVYAVRPDVLLSTERLVDPPDTDACTTAPEPAPEPDRQEDEANFAIAFGVPGLWITDAMRQGIADAAARGAMRGALRQASQYAAESGQPFGRAW